MDLPVTVSYGGIIYVVDDKKSFMISGIHLKSLDWKNWDPIKILINAYKYIKLIYVQAEIGEVMRVSMLILFLSGN